MFEAAELGRRMSKSDFERADPELHTKLLEAQQALRRTDLLVIVIVSGVEGAGKGEVVNSFHKWLDARGLQTFAFWDESDEERERPAFWRFWRTFPPHGTIGIMFGSWYTRPIIDHVYGAIDEARFESQLHRIAELERLLTDDGTLLVKLWFHLSAEDYQRRMKRESGDGKKGWKVSPIAKKFAKRYDAFARASERAIRTTDSGSSPWHVVEASQRRYRNHAAGSILLGRLQAALAAREAALSRPPSYEPAPDGERPASITILDKVDLDQRLEEKDYERELARLQRQLYKQSWKARNTKSTVIAVMEGWDAAGKGSAIRRVTAAMDARVYRVISVAAPTDEEKAHHYLWRFWRQIPRAGYVTIYDRSWYGRVLVERVEGFASAQEWGRAYQEINQFETQLVEHGIVLLKFWLHLDKDEQLRRFEERRDTPWKQHKLTDEDWRNREKWDAYKEAVSDMVARTSTQLAPWTLVAANDKRFARVRVLKEFCTRLKESI